MGCERVTKFNHFFPYKTPILQCLQDATSKIRMNIFQQMHSMKNQLFLIDIYVTILNIGNNFTYSFANN